jgi:hypothetical protein
MKMSTTQVLIHLPDELVRRFKRHISVRQRRTFIQRLLEDALPPEDGGDDDPVYQAALAVEKEHELASEMAEWEAATIETALAMARTPVSEPWRRSSARDSPGRYLVGQSRSGSGGEIRKTRPAVVVTANALNRARRTVVIAPLSTEPQPRPPIVVPTPPQGRAPLP